MWPDGIGPSPEPGRTSTGSEVVVISDQMMQPSQEIPTIASMNIQKSSGIHIGHKFVTVSQTVHKNEVVKGRLLGLELVSPSQSRRLRCSVAIFVCWALVVASGLAIYFFCFALNKEQTSIDIDLSFRKYLWDLVKNSTRAERLLCSTALGLVVLCIVMLIIYFTVIAKIIAKEPDIAPHEWCIQRDDWLAQPYNNTPLEPRYEPARLVIVQHTVSAECHTFLKCASEIRILQDYCIEERDGDVPYNFFIGNDGRVYEGRGWQMEGAHTRGYNRCSVGLGFIGDYREEKGTFTKITAAQENRTQMILEEGVRLGYLDPNYAIVAASDVQITESPGSNLVAAMKRWPHYDHLHRFRNKTCDEIISMEFIKVSR